jgi:AraC family ethanolamine operon transcriptional activator
MVESSSGEPAVQYQRHRFTSFDQFAEAVQGWDLDWCQLDRGVLWADLLQVGSHVGMITRADFARRFMQRGSSPPGCRTFALVDEDVAGVIWCGREFGDQSLAVFDPTGDYESTSPPGFRCNTLSFDEELLASVASTVGYPELPEVLTGRDAVLRVDPEAMRDLRRRLQGFYVALSKVHSASQLGALCHELEFEIPARLVEALMSGRPEERLPRFGSRSDAMRRASEFIEANADDPPSIQEVCRVAGVSWRTLNYAFREQVGVTPKAYLQAVRLNGMRRALVDAEPGTVIADVANRWGFWHMGQLAADYRRQFGELPSDTVRRAS